MRQPQPAAGLLRGGDSPSERPPTPEDPVITRDHAARSLRNKETDGKEMGSAAQRLQVLAVGTISNGRRNGTFSDSKFSPGL